MDASLRGDMVAELADEFVEPTRTRRVDKSLNEARTYYVIHDDDLHLLRDAVAAGASLFPAFKPVATLPTLVALLFRYRRKRARIDAEQAAVLMRLRKALPGGRTAAELGEELDLCEPIGEERVEEVLESLQNLRLTDGTRTDFVVSAGGVWRALDV